MFLGIDLEDDETKKKPKKLPISLYLTSGNYYLHKQNYEEAIRNFNMVLEDDEYNIKALLGVSKAYLKQGKLNESEGAINKILTIAPNNSDAIGIKGVVKYLQGDFETGLIDIWPAFKMRPTRLDLRNGYQVCVNAIDNSLYPGGSLLLNRQDYEEVEKRLKNRNIKFGEAFHKKRCESHSFREDLKFASELMKINAIKEIHPICEDMQLFLKDRKKFWRFENPYRDRMPLKPKIPQWIQNAAFQTFDPSLVYGIAKVKYLDSQQALEHGDIHDSLKIGLEALAILDYIKNYDMTETSKLKVETLQLIGLAHTFKKDYSSALVYFQKVLTLGMRYNLPNLKLKALLCVAETLFKQRKYSEAIEYYKRYLFASESKDFEPNVLYKIGECHLNLNYLQEAHDYVIRALEAALDNKDNRLLLDATLLEAEIYVKGKIKDKALHSYSKALSLARQNDDSRINDIEGLIQLFQEESQNEIKIVERVKLRKKLESNIILTEL